MSKEQPTVSRDVHYVAPGSADGKYPPAHRAAKVTAIPDPKDPWLISCVVFNPTGLHFNLAVPYDSTGQQPGTWHYPERIENV